MALHLNEPTTMASTVAQMVDWSLIGPVVITAHWGYVDERDLQNWKGGVVCMTCQHFAYGVDQHCRTMVGCNLRQKQLQQGEHLKKRCKLWAPTWQKKVGWAPEAG